MSVTHFAQNLSNSGPFDHFDIDHLLTGAARLRPQHNALSDTDGAQMSFAQLHLSCNAFAAALHEAGLQSGDRLLVLAPARLAVVVALLGGLRAGIDVVMAPHHAAPDSIIALCQTLQPQALMAPSHWNDEDMIAVLFQAAALTRSVRLVASLDKAYEGAALFAPDHLSPSLASPHPTALTKAHIITCGKDMQPHRHEQKLLIAAALDYVSRAHIGMRQKIFNLLHPTSLAALVSGPIASLIAGATLMLQSDFEAQTFLHCLEQNGPLHLVAPFMMHDMCETAELLSSDKLYSLSLHHRGPRLPLIKDHAVLQLALLSNDNDTQLSLSQLTPNPQSARPNANALTAHSLAAPHRAAIKTPA
jgi:acyl-CoA synthetase (AMP-forming)/AMP-acid ligase II